MWLTLLNLIPGVSSLIQNVTTAFFNSKVQLTQARIGGDVAVATALVKASESAAHEQTNRLSIIANNKFLTFLLIAAAVPLVGFEWKVIVWDKMLGWGSTDAITGQVADWGNTVWYFLFGSPTVMGLGKLWFSRDKAGE